MVTYVNEHRDRFGVEPICKVLPIAPSTYYTHRSLQDAHERRSARAKRDDDLKLEIQRVWDDNFRVYGVRKVWRQLKREGHVVARCTVARLMRDLGVTGCCSRTQNENNDAGRFVGAPVGPGQSAIQRIINGLYKTDVIRHQGPWRNIEAVEFATLTWVDRFNNRRLFEPIGNVPPSEKEIKYYRKLQGSALAA